MTHGLRELFQTIQAGEDGSGIYRSRQELYLVVFEYVDGFYNSHRPHASLGWLTPNQVEADFGG